MRTTFNAKTLAALAAVLLVAGCTASADPAATPQAFAPGWRHEQMAGAWADGHGPGFGPGHMMMHRAGYTPGAGAAIDPSRLPPWCPNYKAPEQTQ
jgi:hypothetical protein